MAAPLWRRRAWWLVLQGRGHGVPPEPVKGAVELLDGAVQAQPAVARAGHSGDLVADRADPAGAAAFGALLAAGGGELEPARRTRRDPQAVQQV
jgi:hypothetical protein